MRAGEARKQEAIDAVRHRPGEDLGERPRIASVCPLERVQVARSVSLVDDCRGITVANEQEVGRKPSGSPVPVAEGMDLLKTGVKLVDEDRLAFTSPPIGLLDDALAAWLGDRSASPPRRAPVDPALDEIAADAEHRGASGSGSAQWHAGRRADRS